MMPLMSSNSKQRTNRLKRELEQAGMNRYGFLKGETKLLYEIIKEDEHIGGVVYGRSSSGSAMIVATDKRVLYLDRKPLFKKVDELTYDVVSGVSHNLQGQYAGIVLHTRLGDYKLRFVNKTIASRFVKFIEKQQITPEKAPDIRMPEFTREIISDPVQLSQRARIFLMSHEVAVLSTIDEVGRPHGSTVYFAVDKNNYIYIVTKTETQKARNIMFNHDVALTMYDSNSLQTLQINGNAIVEQDPHITKQVYETILRPRFEGQHAEMPPIMYLPAGQYEVIAVTPTHFKFSDYKNMK